MTASSVIVANGFSFGDAVAAVAAANPDTRYAITDGFVPDAPANVTHLAFAEQRGLVPRRRRRSARL